MAESDDPAEAVRRVGGENLLERSYQIASTVYPTEEDKEREKERNSHSFAGDLARKTFGGLISGTGRAAEGLGAFIAGPEEPETDHPLQAVRDVVNAPTRLVGEGISGVGRAISGYGDDISRNVSDEFAARMADSTPSGELFKPGTWSLGEDPTLAGYAAQGAQLFGEFAPVLISGYLTGGLGAAATGGAQALDAARDDADQTIRDLAVSGQIKEMPIYKELTDKGVSHQEAVDQIANMGADYAGIVAGLIGRRGRRRDARDRFPWRSRPCIAVLGSARPWDHGRWHGRGRHSGGDRRHRVQDGQQACHRRPDQSAGRRVHRVGSWRLGRRPHGRDWGDYLGPREPGRSHNCARCWPAGVRCFLRAAAGTGPECAAGRRAVPGIQAGVRNLPSQPGRPAIQWHLPA